MSYLLDKKTQRKNFSRIALGIIILIILFYFRSGIFNGISYVTEIIFHPVLISGSRLGEKLNNLGSYFLSKNSLYLQNQKLQAEVAFNNARMSNYDSVVAENAGLKEILGRLPTGRQAGKNPKINMVLATILAKPNRSPYDTLLVDAGAGQGIKTGDTVFALGDVPIGRIAEIYPSSSKVILFSSAREKTQAIVSGKNTRPNDGSVGQVFLELIGRGGGNFEMVMPKDFILQKGDQAVLPGVTPRVLAIVQTIISDPRDPFTKALLTSPVNIQELKFVEVEL